MSNHSSAADSAVAPEKASLEKASPAKTSAAKKADDAIEAARLAKLRDRRYRWQWNTPLVIGLASGVVLSLAVMALIYRWQSGRTATTLRTLAEQAAEERDFAEQAKWLRRYTMMRPDDIDAVYEMALSADRGVTGENVSDIAKQLQSARKGLGDGIARIGKTDPEKTSELRKRYIKRLLQLGGVWNREIEDQVIRLDSSPGDAESLAFLSKALMGLIQADKYRSRPHNEKDVTKEDAYWAWMANQKIGYVTYQALRANPNDLDLAIGFLDLRRTHPEQFKAGPNEVFVTSDQLVAEEKRIASLLRDTDSGRANLALAAWVAFQNGESEASEVIELASESALQRLVRSSTAPDDSTAETNSTPAPEQILRGTPLSWDFRLALRHGQILSVDDPAAAIDLLTQLSKVDDEFIPTELKVATFSQLGRLFVQEDKFDEAIKTWRTGLAEID
ncbi:MAG: hypothetical protein AAF745_19365, partial [Planctomycetota bacterium]